MGLTRLSYQSNNLTVGSMIGGTRAADGSGEVAVGVPIIFLEFSANYLFFISNAPSKSNYPHPLPPRPTLLATPPFYSSFTTTRGMSHHILCFFHNKNI